MPHAVLGVEPGSIAQQLGIQSGDTLFTINGKHPVDLIDYQAFCAQEKMTLVVARGGEESEYRFTKDEYEPLGLTFEKPLMSRQRDCVNQCVFCFVDQLPSAARDTLRVKDDDWRMSLMMGNFVTLTNVSDAELERIIARRASPLYISVHTTDGDLRAKMLGTHLGAKIMDQLRALSNAQLTFHAQAVICPGYNDGAALDKTVRDLASLYPACRSLALVPVGLTGHREGLCDLKPFDRAGAAQVIDQAEGFRRELRKALGEAFVHAADEFYLLAGRDFPSDQEYEDYPQIENGVGLCRLLEHEYVEAWREADFSTVEPQSVAIACGTSVAEFLTSMLNAHPVPGVKVSVTATENAFFGSSVTVSGLLTGGDLMRAMAGVKCDRLLISGAMLREGGDAFLDDTTLSQVERALNKKIYAVNGGEDLLAKLMGRVGG